MNSHETYDEYEDTFYKTSPQKTSKYSKNAPETTIIYDDDINRQEDVYVHVKFLGQGSFGSVNLYRLSNTNSLVVWKEVDLNRLDAKMRNEAFAEIEILAMLDHSNIITYYKHFVSDNFLYIELEYANGNSLMHLIKDQREQGYFHVDIILWYLYQLCSAVDYIHDFGILHRDIKSLNIFLMKSGLMKLGDFGIAKILDPEVGHAETQVGTPYYMSPEIISGQKYTTKSDIWSIGCVLFELMTLKKVFEASNQLKLAMKIMTCQINDTAIEHYDIQLKSLVHSIFNKEPDQRPTAKDILNNKIFTSKISEFEAKVENLNAVSRKYRMSNTNTKELIEEATEFPVVASKLSECYLWGGGKKIPQKLEIFNQENSPLLVSVGFSHYAVITAEKELYTWAGSLGGSRPINHAKLGHGKAAGVTRSPKRVESLKTVFIKQVSCGEDFTLCLSDDGTLYSFGTDYSGCLGLGDLDDTSIYTPTPVEYFTKRSIKIKRISCGDNHAIALSENNEIFTWGCGEFGRLGHGSEDDLNMPEKVKLPLKYSYRDVVAGTDCSFIITKKGRVLAFGNNENNKLCLNSHIVGLKNMTTQKSLKMNSDVNHQLVPKLIKSLKNYNIIKLACGANHTAAIDSFGRLFTFGNNKYGQLGVGDCKLREGLNMVGGALREHHVINVSCGDTYTVCATSENHVFSWGNKKDGRLGLDTQFDEKSYTCLPRPIYGSLHLVSDMASKFWNSIIIAEQILNSKPLRTVSQNTSSIHRNRIDSQNEPDSAYETYEKNQEISDKVGGLIDFSKNNESFNTSSVPEWLKNDLAEAQPESFKQNSDQSFNTTSIPEWLKKDLDEGAYIPMDAVRKPQNNDQSFNTSNVPDWLKRDLEEGIPIDALKLTQSVKIELKESQSDFFKNQEYRIDSLEEALDLIDQLREENSVLKEVNAKLITENIILKRNVENK